MRKILTFILILCTVALFAEMRGGALYDPGAMRTGNTALAATGTAVAPAYSFGSDPNTGMYSAGADSIGFSKGGAEVMRITNGGNVLIATSTDDGANKLQVNGFSKFGEAATGVKMKVLTGTTAAAEGGDALVAHGVTGSKIVSWSAQVDISGDVLPPEYSRSAGLKFHTYFDGTNVYIINHATESENILSKPFTVTIWYKE